MVSGWPSSSPTARRGFTLIELLIVMVVLGVLFAIGMFLFNDVRDSGEHAVAKSRARAALIHAGNVYINNANTFPVTLTADLNAAGELDYADVDGDPNGEDVEVDRDSDQQVTLCSMSAAERVYCLRTNMREVLMVNAAAAGGGDTILVAGGHTAYAWGSSYNDAICNLPTTVAPPGEACGSGAPGWGGGSGGSGGDDPEDLVSYADEVNADTPAVWWRLDETAGATTYADAAGSSDGSAVGNPSEGEGGAGGTGTALAVSGDTDWVDVGQPADLKPTGSFSVEAWYKTSQASFGFVYFAPAERAYGISIDASGRIGGFVYWGGGGLDSTDVLHEGVGSATNDDQWHHVVMVYDGDDVVLYVDGDEVDRETFGGAAPHYLDSYNGAIGRYNGNGGMAPHHPFNGTIDEVAIYHHDLSAARVEAHHTAGTTSP